VVAATAVDRPHELSPGPRFSPATVDG
jgi:hypothetical protein